MTKVTNEIKAEEGKEIVIREGKAPDVLVPQILIIQGTIKAPAEYAEKRKSEFKAVEAHVLYNYKLRMIELITDEKYVNNTSVEGELKLSDELKKLKIYVGEGDPEMFSIKSLGQLIRFNKRFFSILDEADATIENLAKFKASAQTQIEASRDTRGNKSSMLDLKVQTNIPLFFNIEVPIFKGFEKKKFKVDICFDLRETNLELWLESPELSQILDSETKALIDAEKEKLKEYVCIEQ